MMMVMALMMKITMTIMTVVMMMTTAIILNAPAIFAATITEDVNLLISVTPKP